MDQKNFLIPNKNNILPYDGETYYYGKIFNQNDSDYFHKNLMKNIDWKNDEAIIFGKKIITKRKYAWYGNDNYSYTYSKRTRVASKWSPILLEIKEIIESQTNEIYNSCLLNLYHNGSEGMAYHSDAEKDLVSHATIASLSFGAERKFSFKHKNTKERISLNLEDGSLLTMKGETQDHWLHSIPTTKRVNEPRINLTFRKINLVNYS